MKLKNIICILLFILMCISNYLLYKEYTTLTTENFTILVNNTFYGCCLMITYISTFIVIIFIFILGILIFDNWNKTITLNSILKTIKSIKLN